ncbi:MAG: metal ABC transporter permease [Oscillospiraceae bacterium]
MLDREFMLRALLAGAVLALAVPCIGLVVVLRRLSMIGDALSHTSLSGVALGLLLGFNPVVGAVVACVLAALGIEGIRRRFPKYGEISIAVVLSLGVGLAGLLSGLGDNAVKLNRYMFGSILTITDLEMGLTLVIGGIVVLASLLFYKEFFLLSLDERAARLAGVPVRAVETMVTVLTALTVAVASRIVGALIISSLMVLPVACAMQLSRSYKGALGWSVVFAQAFTLVGLTAAYYMDLQPGAAIVLTGVAALLLVFAGKGLFALRRRKVARR